jgi:hypothetical protein
MISATSPSKVNPMVCDPGIINNNMNSFHKLIFFVNECSWRRVMKFFAEHLMKKLKPFWR